MVLSQNMRHSTKCEIPRMMIQSIPLIAFATAATRRCVFSFTELRTEGSHLPSSLMFISTARHRMNVASSAAFVRKSAIIVSVDTHRTSTIPLSTA